MLLPAAQNLSSPCLPESWNDAYEAWAYLFVTISIVFMQLIDFLIEGAYQKYIERRGGQPHVEACHEQAHDHDKHTHHAAVVGALVSMHSSKAQLHGNMPSASEPPSDVEAGQTESSELGEDGGECGVRLSGCKQAYDGSAPSLALLCLCPSQTANCAFPTCRHLRCAWQGLQHADQAQA